MGDAVVERRGVEAQGARGPASKLEVTFRVSCQWRPSNTAPR